MALEVWKIKRDTCSRQIINLLHKAGATVATNSKRITEEAMNGARSGDIELLTLFHDLGMNLEIADIDGKNILHHVNLILLQLFAFPSII